jgi:uncharacterized membrane protein YfcA
MPEAVATSLVIIVANSASGFVAHLGDAHLQTSIAVPFILAAITGSLVAGRVANRLPASKLRHWFAYLVFAVAAFVIYRAATG